jgi:hypothetical protein
MIDTDKYEGHTPAPWLNHNPDDPLAHRHDQCDFMVGTYQKSKNGSMYFKLVADWGGCVNCLPDANSVIAEYPDWANARLIADAPLLLAEVKRLQSEPTVTVDDYHKKGHLYVTVHFPDGEQYVGLVEKWEGEEE